MSFSQNINASMDLSSNIIMLETVVKVVYGVKNSLNSEKQLSSIKQKRNANELQLVIEAIHFYKNRVNESPNKLTVVLRMRSTVRKIASDIEKKEK